MTRSVSVGTMIKQLYGLVGSSTMGRPDLNDWATRFVRNVHDATMGGDHTSNLTGNQVEKIEELFHEHFA